MWPAPTWIRAVLRAIFGHQHHPLAAGAGLEDGLVALPLELFQGHPLLPRLAVGQIPGRRASNARDLIGSSPRLLNNCVRPAVEGAKHLQARVSESLDLAYAPG